MAVLLFSYFGNVVLAVYNEVKAAEKYQHDSLWEYHDAQVNSTEFVASAL